MTDLTKLTDADLASLHRAVLTQIAHRASLATMEADAAATNERYLRATGREPGQPWEQPSGAHNAYPAGWEVTHDNKTWQSLTPANVWEPGISGWREAVDESSGPPEWIRPTGAHDAYQTGDRVTFEGSVYESVIDSNTWSPTEHPAGWQLIDGGP